MQADKTNNPSNEISQIDGKPIITISAADYYQANMRTWSYLFFPTFESGYSEGSRLDYFPIVPLITFSWRALLMENDAKYPYANMRRRDVLGHDVWTYNMADGGYDNIYTTVNGKRTTYGKSDDLMWHSGISNITEANVDSRLAGKSEITTTSPGGFKYILKKVYRTAELKPVN